MCQQGKGTVVVKKDQRGSRDPSGNKQKNEIVREKTKKQAQNPDPNAVAK